mmetsp:Transcript_6626/g.23402  ORF Transcript_6626/g.23402 Transcript_6626/m.23402 type:complete len:211 (+) Transcript_6626:2556-3188(+)
MALAMLSTAILRKPSATCSGARASPVAASMSFATFSKFVVVAATSSGSSWLGPNTCGKKSGCSLPIITLQSVTARGPPRRYAVGPGLAPALSGPTRKRPPSKKHKEPPPAATVWMSIIGARILTPATSVSKALSSSPSKCATSVDVPPMSNVMSWSKPAACAVRTLATMPPAGPDRMASLPWKSAASVSPPLLCMNCSRTSPSSPATCCT